MRRARHISKGLDFASAVRDAAGTADDSNREDRLSGDLSEQVTFFRRLGSRGTQSCHRQGQSSLAGEAAHVTASGR